MNTSKVLTNRDARVQRLVCMMDLRWRGRTLREIGEAHGISRQRVHVVLASVGCRRHVSRAGDRECRRLPRCASESRVAEARAILATPSSRRLSTLQRGAIAWEAAGLVVTDIAWRMNRSPRGVRDFLAGGRWRMERLMREAEHRSARKVLYDPLPEFDLSDIEALLTPK